MFKMGGSTEDVGIMNGMRARYEKGTGNQGAQKRDVLATPGLSPFLIDFGLNLLSATPRGRSEERRVGKKLQKYKLENLVIKKDKL